MTNMLFVPMYHVIYFIRWKLHSDIFVTLFTLPETKFYIFIFQGHICKQITHLLKKIDYLSLKFKAFFFLFFFFTGRTNTVRLVLIEKRRPTTERTCVITELPFPIRPNRCCVYFLFLPSISCSPLSLFLPLSFPPLKHPSKLLIQGSSWW